MRALVTGGTGKVGNAVARALHRRGATRCGRWCATPRGRPACCPIGVEPVRGDVTIPDVRS